MYKAKPICERYVFHYLFGNEFQSDIGGTVIAGISHLKGDIIYTYYKKDVKIRLYVKRYV